MIAFIVHSIPVSQAATFSIGCGRCLVKSRGTAHSKGITPSMDWCIRNLWSQSVHPSIEIKEFVLLWLQLCSCPPYCSMAIISTLSFFCCWSTPAAVDTEGSNFLSYIGSWCVLRVDNQEDTDFSCTAGAAEIQVRESICQSLQDPARIYTLLLFVTSFCAISNLD